MKNDVGIDHGCDLEAPQPRFFFLFLLLLLNFTKSFQYMKVEPLPSAPSCLFIGNEGTSLIYSSPRRAIASTWSNVARPCELSSPRRAGYFTPKLFGGPSEPEAILGEPGVKKTSKWPFCPPFWIFSAFFIETSKNLSYCTTTSVKQLNSASNNQNVSKW